MIGANSMQKFQGDAPDVMLLPAYHHSHTLRLAYEETKVSSQEPFLTRQAVYCI